MPDAIEAVSSVAPKMLSAASHLSVINTTHLVAQSQGTLVRSVGRETLVAIATGITIGVEFGALILSGAAVVALGGLTAWGIYNLFKKKPDPAVT